MDADEFRAFLAEGKNSFIILPGPQEYYTDRLYPLQDGIIGIVKNLNTPFYLTGGTALSRCYLQHRYSDDPDFFVNTDEEYARMC